ncbi:SRPBCC domain-containing protein [Pseudooceanicola sp. C21-150M6]|uniref:SRPBCC domain-containing protein n=1 Tax=Pseudooceanicola sp. C21-150M6 TaxID=3434355 RepID=UPI003D7F41D2
MTFTPNPETDLSFTRTLPASRDLVWACWTDPKLLKQWFMPAPHFVEETEIDLRPGGIFRTRMNVDGQIMDNPGVILEALPGRRLVFTDAYAPGWVMNPQAFMTAILQFSDVEGGTQYDVLVRHGSPEAKANHEKMGFFDGWGQVADQLGRSAQALAGPKPDHEILLTRQVDVPPALAWKAWTDPALLPKWWGPDGYHCETESIDLRPGGHWRFTMIGGGKRYPNLHEFGEMVPETRLTYKLSGFDDMHHHADVVVDFTPEAGGTRVTMRMTMVDSTAAAALDFGALEAGYQTLASLETLMRTA